MKMPPVPIRCSTRSSLFRTGCSIVPEDPTELRSTRMPLHGCPGRAGRQREIKVLIFRRLRKSFHTMGEPFQLLRKVRMGEAGVLQNPFRAAQLENHAGIVAESQVSLHRSLGQGLGKSFAHYPGLNRIFRADGMNIRRSPSDIDDHQVSQSLFRAVPWERS